MENKENKTQKKNKKKKLYALICSGIGVLEVYNRKVEDSFEVKDLEECGLIAEKNNLEYIKTQGFYVTDGQDFFRGFSTDRIDNVKIADPQP